MEVLLFLTFMGMVFAIVIGMVLLAFYVVWHLYLWFIGYFLGGFVGSGSPWWPFIHPGFLHFIAAVCLVTMTTFVVQAILRNILRASSAHR